MESPRNYLLDGLRGVAALGVVFYHAGLLTRLRFVPNGYLAVDFFFILSGFVIDRAYRGRLAGGLSTVSFMVIRLYRLYPLFSAEVVLGIIRLVLKFATHQLDLTGAQIALTIVFNTLMLPLPFAYRVNFPLNTPAWSLFCEIVINLIFAAGLVRASRAVLWTVIAAGGAGMVFGAVTTGALDLGWRSDTMIFGLARVAFGFTLGMGLARWVQTRPTDARAAHAALPIVLLVATLMAPIPHWLRPIFDLSFAFIVAPLIIVLGTRARLSARFTPALYWLGMLSYPIYALHGPLMQLVDGALRSHLPRAAVAVAMVAASIVAAVVGERLLDLRARRLSGKYLARVTGKPASATAVRALGA